MPNNQDAVNKRIIFPQGYYWEPHNFQFDGKHDHCLSCLSGNIYSPEGKIVLGYEKYILPFSQAMNAPTPREQELEAQNKALWELVKEYAECEGYSPLDKKAKRLLAAIQKAKESR
jgi:hypothetical protein